MLQTNSNTVPLAKNNVFKKGGTYVSVTYACDLLYVLCGGV